MKEKWCNGSGAESNSSWLFSYVCSLQEKFYGKELILADREMVESNSEEILKDAHTEHVAFLVVGDPFGSAS